MQAVPGDKLKLGVWAAILFHLLHTLKKKKFGSH